MPRSSIKNFELANPIYRGAQVTFYTVAGGAKTATKATLYAGTSGVAQLGNPQKLDKNGKFKQPVYIEAPVIGTIEGLTVPTHDTGIVSPAPTFRVASTGEVQYSFDGGVSWNSSDGYLFRDRGDWAGPGTVYKRTDLVRVGAALYVAFVDHTSTASFAADLASVYWKALFSLTAADITFLQSGTGASATTVQTELRSRVRPEQFGAVGDGTTDDGLPLRRAITSLSSGGTLILKNATTYATTLGLGIQGIKVEGNGATIKAIGAGSSAYLLDANLQRDHSTTELDGKQATVRNLKIDGNSQTWHGLRTSGGRSSADNVEITGCVNGLVAYLPIAATFKDVYSHDNSGIGIFTTAATGANATSTTFLSCWADTNGSHGFHITQLYYSSLIGCVGQANTGDDIRIEGSVNGAGAGVSLALHNCASEGATAKPFNIIAQRECVVTTPRIISPPSDQDFITFDNSNGVVISYSSMSTPGSGQYAIAVVNDSTGIERPVKLIGGGSSGTLTVNDEDLFSFVDVRINSRTRTLMNSLEIGQIVYDDDFVGDSLDPRWHTIVGSDPQCVAATPAQARGVARLTTGDDAAASMAVNGTQLVHGVNWQASLGGLSAEFRVAISAITNVCVFIGFIDQISTLIAPFTLGGGDALTSNSADAVGVLFDTAADTDDWWLVGVASNVDATKQDSGVAPSAGTYETWKIELSTAGVATFYRNGALIGLAMSGAVTAGTALTPYVGGFARGAASRNIDVDRIRLTMNR